MEEKIEQEEIDSKYTIIEKIGAGGQANAFLVEEKETKKEYVAKVLKREDSKTIKNEIDILKELKAYNNPNIIKIIDSGKGIIIRKNRKKRERDYFIMEKILYGNIFDYIFCKKSGLGELKSKVIFYKIFEGIKCCHENNICHRDLKLENILLDEKINPKICDFGFACKNGLKLEEYLGTPMYKPPEINNQIPYDGKKADIFSLGAALIILVTGKCGFKNATKSDPLYCNIISKDYNIYWSEVEENLSYITLSPEFKDLFIKMIKCDPEERITIEDILDHPWFNELKDLKKNNLEKLKNTEIEIKKFFDNLMDDVKKSNIEEINSDNIKSEIASYNTKSINIDINQMFFASYIESKFEGTTINMKNCIKIKGYLEPNKFMNNLCNLIVSNYGVENCYIEASKKNLKFELIFEEEDDNKDDDKKEKNEDKIFNNLKMKIKLYKYSDGHLLNFIQVEGNRKDFLEKFIEIEKLVKIILN